MKEKTAHCQMECGLTDSAKKCLFICHSVKDVLLMLEFFIPISTGEQLALPVVNGEEQNHYWPQEYRGTKGVVHPSTGWYLPLYPQCLLLACIS